MDTKLPAGPELDQLIALKVMGWTLTESGHPDFDRGNWIDADGNFRHCSPTSYIGLLPFLPSTKIAHAWEVVEHMNGRGLLLSRICRSSEGAFYWVNFDDQSVNTCGNTAPLAICYAALAAVSNR